MLLEVLTIVFRLVMLALGLAVLVLVFICWRSAWRRRDLRGYFVGLGYLAFFGHTECVFNGFPPAYVNYINNGKLVVGSLVFTGHAELNLLACSVSVFFFLIAMVIGMVYEMQERTEQRKAKQHKL